MRILIADDDRDLAEVLAEFVRECNHEVVDTVTGGGLAVIQSFARHLPDLVLLDIMMPRYNGLTVSHALVSRKPDVKIVFVSGRVEEDNPMVANCPSVAYLRKPVMFDELRDLLDRLSSPEASPAEAAAPEAPASDDEEEEPAGPILPSAEVAAA